MAHYADILVPGLPVGALNAALEPTGGLGGLIGWLADAGEEVGMFGRVLQPFRDLAATLVGNWSLILIIAGAALFLAGRRVFPARGKPVEGLRLSCAGEAWRANEPLMWHRLEQIGTGWG